MAERFRLGIDIGGTFTDFVLVDEQSGRVFLNKCLTTPQDPRVGVLNGLTPIMQMADISGSDLKIVIHGTTLITNALIERKGARTAFLATSGHRDVLEIGTEMRYDTYDLFLERPEPLAPRYLRHDVPERCGPDGRVVQVLDEAAVREIARSLGSARTESVAVCLLHSFVNPAHEQRVREILKEELPGVAVSLSCEVAPEIREYQRMSTTVANAYVQPIADRYLRRLHADLTATGYARPLYLMLSSGGIATHETAVQFPIRLVESGPAGGALATATLGRRMGRPDLIAFDMGGTTAKATVIDEGEPTTAKEFEVARVRRFKKGSGLPLQVPVIEMIEIGAGGGSIAHLDEIGLLKVGPESAGADPGPACYRQGGTEPTVTDADLVLGYLAPDFFLGGSMSLDAEAARAALRRVAGALGVDEVRLARGIYEVVNGNMIGAAKVHIAERGRDPRRYSMVAFGGMGPMHAHAVARGLKVNEVICPASAGVLSAWGMLVAPIAFEYAQSLLGNLDADLLRRAGDVFARMRAEGERLLLEAGVAPADICFVRSLDMRYAGQSREISIPLPEVSDEAAADRVRQAFFERYRTLYGHAHADVTVQVVTCRLTATSPPHDLPNRVVTGDAGDARKGERMAYFETAGAYVATAVYDRYKLRPGATFTGPAVVEERESTAVVPPGASVRVDEELNLIIRLDGGE